ncbi:MAG: HigA family addiction module antitoxin [Mariprofundaceae bacterium]
MSTLTSPIPPGAHLEEFIEEFGITKYRLSQVTGMPQSRIGEIINKGRAITADTAFRLSAAFGTTAQFWINLQVAYDLNQAKVEHGDDYARITKVAA